MYKRFYVKQGRRSEGILVLFVFVFVVVVILLGLYFLGASEKSSELSSSSSLRGTSKAQSSKLKVPSPTASASAKLSASLSGSLTAVPSVAVLDRSLLRIVILNGSGTAGAARGTSAYLSGLGYTVVSVGNADGFAYRNVTVLVKKSKSSYAQLLKKDLEGNGASVSASLSEQISGDAEVIIGR